MSSYSEDEFELSLSAVSSVGDGDTDTGPDTREAYKEDDSNGTIGSEEIGFKPTVVLSNEKGGAAGEAGDDGDVSDAGYSSFNDGEEPLPLISPSFTVGERDGRTNKQKYLDLNKKAGAVWQEANDLAQRRNEEELQLRLQAQQTKESWHDRIHRRYTELEWHRKVSEKTAQSAIDMALYREAWTKGVLCARSRAAGRDQAFSSAFGSLQARTLEREEAAVSAERRRAEERAEACSTVWDAARHGVPVRKLRELMDAKIERSRRAQTHTYEARNPPAPSTNFDPSETFEQLCRRVAGIVVESRHPYPKGVRQDVEAYVPNAESFYVAFDAASNATMGMGKIALQEIDARDPTVFFPRGPYNNGDSSGEARLPGVNGEPPMRVEGSSVLITFSASYWAGVAPPGEDYGWRMVCFTASDGDEAKALIAQAEKAADRAAAVDAVNVNGETCLHVASFEGNVAAARYLLSVDADPNSAHTASGYNTPLHEAARSGSLAVIRLLLKSSANVLAVNSHGDNPLHVASREGRVDIARRLLAHDSDWATVAACNHAGLRPSEVVLGCSALASLLDQVELTAAQAAAKAAIAADAVASGNRAPPLLPPAGSKKRPSLRRNSDLNRGATAAVAAASSGPLGGGGGGGGFGVGLRGGGGRVGALRRRGVGRTKAGGGARASSLDASARALLSGSILPRWTRLARPVGEEWRRRRRRGPLDVPRQQHQQQQHHHQQQGEVGSDDDTEHAPVASEVEESEAQSAAGWSGTSYGASLTDSDFGIPPPVVVVRDGTLVA